MTKAMAYATLQVPPGSSLAAVKAAYRERILAVHPDKGGSAEAFRKVRQAWEILGLEDCHRQTITEFKQDLQAYKAGFAQEAFFFYWTGLEFAKDQLCQVAKDLDLWDAKMAELPHTATCPSGAEDLRRSRHLMLAMRNDLAIMKSLWDLEATRIDASEGFLGQKWSQAVPAEMEKTFMPLLKTLKEIKKVWWDCDAYLGIYEAVERWTIFSCLVGELQDPAMRPRHWARIMEHCGKQMKIGSNVPLRDLWNLKLYKKADAVKDTVRQARQEWKMETLKKALNKGSQGALAAPPRAAKPSAAPAQAASSKPSSTASASAKDEGVWQEVAGRKKKGRSGAKPDAVQHVASVCIQRHARGLFERRRLRVMREAAASSEEAKEETWWDTVFDFFARTCCCGQRKAPRRA